MTDGPNIGIIVPPSSGFMDVCREADRLGFHSLWAMDTPFHSIHNREPLAFLASVAAATTRIRLGTPVIWTLMRDLVDLAAEASNVDRLSNGRLTLGVSQDQWPGEHHSGSSLWTRRGGRLEESITLLKRLWSEDEVSFQGGHFRVENASIPSKPVQAGGIPILVGGTTLAAVRIAATMADGWVHPARGMPEEMILYRHAVRGMASEAGRDPDSLEVGKVVYLAIDQDKVQAWHKLSPLHQFYGRGYNVNIHGAYGQPAECAAFIRRVLDAGTKTVLLALPQLDIGELERVHREVLPLLA